MSDIRYSLCPNCDACPEVVIGEDAVVIGEEGNQARLSLKEWNVLVEGVRSGVLHPASAAAEDAAHCECGCDCC
jgi:hypothetical protein